MFHRKSSSNNRESLENAPTRTSIISVLRLLISVTSLMIFSVNIQRYYHQTSTPGVFQWLKLLDEETGVGKKTDHLKSSRFFWPEIFSGLSSIIKWCSVNYTWCLLTMLISQILVVYISGQKWFSKCGLICLFCLCLLLMSGWHSERWLTAGLLLSGVTCYLRLILTVGDKMFGQGRKKKRKLKKVEDKEQEPIEQEPIEQEPEEAFQEERQINNKKLKLPDELDEIENVEEKLNVDEDIISSLSLGPGSQNNARNRNNNGSWFRQEFNGSFKTSNKRPDHASGSKSLIWPAKFHVNGFSAHGYGRNTLSDSISDNNALGMSGFSDDEDNSFQPVRSYKGERNMLRASKRGKRMSWSNCGNVQRFILVCSLILNIIFLWIWMKNS